MIYLFQIGFLRLREPTLFGGQLPIDVTISLMRNITDPTTRRNLLRASPRLQVYFIDKFWLCDTVYVDMRASREQDQVAWDRRRHPLSYRFTVVNNGPGLLGKSPPMVSQHRFNFPRKTWAPRPRAGNFSTQWYVFCGDVSENHSRLTHLCVFQFMSVNSPRPPVPIGSRGPQPYVPQYDDPALPRPPVVQDPAIINMLLNGNAHNRLWMQQDVIRFNWMEATNLAQRLWLHHMQPLEITIDRPGNHYDLKYGLMSRLFPSLPQEPPFSRPIRYSTAVKRHREVAGQGPKWNWIEQLVLLVWTRMYDLRCSDDENFRRATRDTSEEVR